MKRAGSARARAPAASGSRSPAEATELQDLGGGELAYRSLEDALSVLLERIRAELGVDTAAVLLLDEDRGVLVARAARGLEEEVREGVRVPLARGFAGRVAAQARPIVLEDLKTADVVNPILRQKGIRSMVGVPVQVEGRVIGVMHVGSLVTRAFAEEDIARLQRAADRAAVMIDDARLAEQRAVTEVMQRTLLPDEFPRVPGLRLSAKYLPAGSGIKVGGDWYDVFELPNGRMALVIGDVVGRGVTAASVMAEARTALRAYLIEGHGVREAMSLLNDLLISLGRNRAATVAILELDLELGQVDAVSAGHLPAVVMDGGGSASLWHLPQGPPLGITHGQRYQSERRPFGADNALLLFTDGLVEVRGEVIDAGLERLRAAAEAAATGGLGSFADRVYWTLTGQTALEDDVALLAI
ncbi:MAG TPA: GAF domain-containing SpoIIE family protein phosphatase, partial [Solirubrobacteraceae bacterium]|nr:GAF domain-containing SpoIIE family protein phosphatase [Solirubrobacteraceae bacterium]